jgi:hypothetical protein
MTTQPALDPIAARRRRRADNKEIDPMAEKSPQEQLDGFLAKYTPEIAAKTKTVIAKLRRRLPGMIQLVYDNYNGLVVAFGPTERASDVVFSIVAYPKWINLFFLRNGPRLPDPEKLLKGSGTKVRHILVDSPSDLDKPAIQALISEALAQSDTVAGSASKSRIVIKSISAKQRPRRPSKV